MVRVATLVTTTEEPSTETETPVSQAQIVIEAEDYTNALGNVENIEEEGVKAHIPRRPPCSPLLLQESSKSGSSGRGDKGFEHTRGALTTAKQ